MFKIFLIFFLQLFRAKPVQSKPTRSTSLTRGSSSGVPVSKNRPNRSVAQSRNSRNTHGNERNSRITSSTSSSRTDSRPNTAASVRESHENSILYSLNVISTNCIQKTKAILGDMVGDIRYFFMEKLKKF